MRAAPAFQLTTCGIEHEDCVVSDVVDEQREAPLTISQPHAGHFEFTGALADVARDAELSHRSVGKADRRGVRLNAAAGAIQSDEVVLPDQRLPLTHALKMLAPFASMPGGD
jgi:hypothetical protein